MYSDLFFLSFFFFSPSVSLYKYSMSKALTYSSTYIGTGLHWGRGEGEKQVGDDGQSSNI